MAIQSPLTFASNSGAAFTFGGTRPQLWAGDGELLEIPGEFFLLRAEFSR